MKRWRRFWDWKDGLEELHFARGMENYEPLAATNTVFAALWPVMRPLSVDLGIVAKPHDSSVTDYEIPVPVSHWHLYNKYPPAHVKITKFSEVKWVRPPSPYSQEEIPELSLRALADWLTRAHAQQLPEGYIPVLERLEMSVARARLLEDQGPFAEMVFGQETDVVPVEKREDGLWVSGPWWESVSDPPIEIELCHTDCLNDADCEQQILTITINWSPWVEAGWAEAELFKNCLHELEKHGWEGDGERTTDWLRRT